MMNPGIHGAIAATNRRKKLRQEHEEEERMSRYSEEELEGEWEFKIVRSEFPVFRNPQTLQNVLDEEAQAGWQMLEKLDDNRVRLKRHVSSKRRDTMLPAGVDPYRTRVRGTAPGMIAVIAGISLTLILGILVFLLGFEGAGFDGQFPFIIVAIASFVLILVVAAVFGRARS